jgi:hypothetical protein
LRPNPEQRRYTSVSTARGSIYRRQYLNVSFSGGFDAITGVVATEFEELVVAQETLAGLQDNCGISFELIGGITFSLV